jgi:putative transcriptional regulator
MVISAHLEHCEKCQPAVARAEEVHGQILESLADTAMAPDALQLALARIDTPAKRAPASLGDVPLPEAVACLGLRSRRFLGPEFWIAPVRGVWSDNWRLYLLRAPAGTRIPEHRHRGQEMFQVLTGAVRDRQLHRQGDFAVLSHGVDHALEVTTDGPCACLVAAENGARWTGLTRALSPLLGI